MSQISIADGKAKFAAMVRRAEAGERILVTRNGRPVACLGPAPAQKPIRYGDMADLAHLVPEDLSLPQDVLDDFERALDKFDSPP